MKNLKILKNIDLSENLTIEEINTLNNKITNLERLCKTLLHQVKNNMTWSESSNMTTRNSTCMTISRIQKELQKLQNKHLEK
jgi:hypothetical protein